MRFPVSEFAKLKERLIIYDCAIKTLKTRIDIFFEDFSKFQSYEPVEHIKTRLKSPESIAEKLHRQKLAVTSANACKYLTDIAGIRCICYYAKDIYYIADVLKGQPDINVISEKDYVSNPKPSGYRSYHLILEVPVYLTDRIEYIPVEVQIRTQAMDFWATLEHKVKYKYKDEMPEHISADLVDCAQKIAEIDERMHLIQDIIDLAYQHKDEHTAEDSSLIERTFNFR